MTATQNITKEIDGDYTTYKAIVRKTETQIVIGPFTKSVHIKNASNRAWRGNGKFFPNFKAMSDGYKTAEMKELVAYVEKDQQPANVVQFANN